MVVDGMEMVWTHIEGGKIKLVKFGLGRDKKKTPSLSQAGSFFWVKFGLFRGGAESSLSMCVIRFNRLGQSNKNETKTFLWEFDCI